MLSSFRYQFKIASLIMKTPHLQEEDNALYVGIMDIMLTIVTVHAKKIKILRWKSEEIIFSIVAFEVNLE